MAASGSQPAVVFEVAVATVAGVEVVVVVAVVVVAAVVVAAVVVVADDGDDDEGQVPRLKLVIVGLLAHRQGLFLFQSSLIELKINFRW